MAKREPPKKPSGKTAKPSPAHSVRLSEQLLIDAVARTSAERVFCTSLGRAQFAWHYAEQFAGSQVACLFLDIYQAQRAETLKDPRPANLNILCAADPPDEEFDLVAMPLTQGGEAELSRDLMQSAYQQLREGGQMITTVDNPRDTWLHGEMQRLFDKVTQEAGRKGMVYRGTKRGPLKKFKDFRSEFKFRDGEQLITVMTRPGVFSHRRLDTGARALMEVMQIQPGDRVLDLGCGAGVLSLAAAFRAPAVHLLAMDANARAIECTAHNAALNGVDTLKTKLNASAQIEEEGTFDVVLANPPYFSSYRISEIFLKGARRALKPGGQVYLVTKNTEWYEENMPKPFRDASAIPSRDYTVMRGIRR